jgi:hypothetical protein
LRREVPVIVHFGDIGEIVDHHCLNFLFLIKTFFISIIKTLNIKEVFLLGFFFLEVGGVDMGINI